MNIADYEKNQILPEYQQQETKKRTSLIIDIEGEKFKLDDSNENSQIMTDLHIRFLLLVGHFDDVYYFLKSEDDYSLGIMTVVRNGYIFNQLALSAG